MIPEYREIIPQRFCERQLDIFEKSRISEHCICLKQHQFRRLSLKRGLQHVIGLLYPLSGLATVICRNSCLLPQIHRRDRSITLAVSRYKHVYRLFRLLTHRCKHPAASLNRSGHITDQYLYSGGTDPQQNYKS